MTPSADRELPLVSIVTPSLNQGRFIEEAIRSVLYQEYANLEHIVVDGGSTDGTLDILRRYPHLRWISEPDEGQADAINKGFRLARGEILGWINADDFYLPGAIATAAEVLRTTGCALVHGGWRQVDENGATIRDVRPVPFDLRLQLESRNAVAQPGSLFTRDAFWAVGGVDVRYRFALDYDLWLKLGARYEVRHVDGTLAAYRYHPESKTEAEYASFWPETHLASRRNGGRYFSSMYVRMLSYKHPRLARALVLARPLARWRRST